MNDDEIDALAQALAAKREIYWVYDGQISKCLLVIKEWYEIYPGNIKADVAEPAVALESGKFAALYLSDPREFFYIQPVFKADNMPVCTQAEAIAHFLPVIEQAGKVYAKFTTILARPAVVGEEIVTCTSAGVETKNTAKAGDYVCQNRTTAKEQYILSGEKLASRYKLVDNQISAEPWLLYQAVGECQGMTYIGPDTEFIAHWGETMVLKSGDMIVTPLPEKGQVYRIGAQEFKETYAPSCRNNPLHG